MSPLLFAMVSEPLALAVRKSTEIVGFKQGLLEENVILYADDTFFLRDTMTSLARLMSLICRFGHFSGLDINWVKSMLLPLDPLRAPLPDDAGMIKIVDHSVICH